jgi:hypothetical protein
MADEDLVDELAEPALPLRAGVEGFVREYPLAAVLGALVTGIILGRIGTL